MGSERNINDFEEKIGYCFKNKGLLTEALSHSSYSNEKSGKKGSNERLEFLGDSVLSVIVSEYLFKKYRHLPEGDLTKIRASLVCEKALFEFAKTIELSGFILLGKGEESGSGRERPSIVSDAFEAVIAAVYLDGGLGAAKKYVLGFIPEDLKDYDSEPMRDYKTILQETIQKKPDNRVEYVIKDQIGPDHDRSFTAEVTINSQAIGSGVGRSKKQAEQMAAKAALKYLSEINQ